jgi:toxin ParE1/3/4
LSKRVIPSNRANLEIVEAADHYALEGGERLAERFIDALRAAFDTVAKHPGIGSPRYAHELGMEGLRCWKLTTFPYLVLYVEREDRIEVMRVLHGARDIPATLAD